MAESSERALTPDEAMDVPAARPAPPVRDEGARTIAVDLARSSPEDP